MAVGDALRAEGSSLLLTLSIKASELAIPKACSSKGSARPAFAKASVFVKTTPDRTP
jgi:hypothetical protein